MSAMDAHHQMRHSIQGRNGSGDAALSRSYSTAAAVTTSSTTQQQTPALSSCSNNDINLAPILFGVVIVFVICNSLRVILNIYDFSVVDHIIECESQMMGRYPPAWILCTISVSHLLLMVNSSVNFLVYCVAGTRFRSILAKKFRKKFRAFRKALHCGKQKKQSYLSAQPQNQKDCDGFSVPEGNGKIPFGYTKDHRQLLIKPLSSPKTSNFNKSLQTPPTTSTQPQPL